MFFLYPFPPHAQSAFANSKYLISLLLSSCWRLWWWPLLDYPPLPPSPALSLNLAPWPIPSPYTNIYLPPALLALRLQSRPQPQPRPYPRPSPSTPDHIKQYPLKPSEASGKHLGTAKPVSFLSSPPSSCITLSGMIDSPGRGIRGI